MKKTSILLASIILIASTLSSCGVMFGGSRYQGTIIAQGHPNADIYVNGAKVGMGTVHGQYYRNRPLQVEVKAEGCEPYKKTYYSTLRTGNFILSVITWGILGIALDLGTGAAYKPDHRNQSSVSRQSDKHFTFSIEPDECTKSTK